MGNNNQNKQQNNNQSNRHQNNKHNDFKKPPIPKNPDPMSNTKLMAREGMKIIRNIAYGKFNIYNEGHIFRNIDFVKATLSEVEKRMTTLFIHITAINYAYNGTSDNTVLEVLHRDRREYEAYELVRQTLYGIIQTGDTRLLFGLASRLPQYKYNI